MGFKEESELRGGRAVFGLNGWVRRENGLTMPSLWTTARQGPRLRLEIADKKVYVGSTGTLE